MSIQTAGTAAPSTPTPSVAEPDWQARAACRGMGSVFFPEVEHHKAAVERARAICRECPVRRECLDMALSLPCMTSGIWGGTTTAQRDGIRRRLRRG